MKKNLIRVIAALPAIPMLLNGIGFLARPEETAASLGMELLEGIGLSTQLGDMTAFFVGTAVLIILGAVKAEGRWLYAGAMFLGAAAAARTLAAVVAGAAMAKQFIVIEIIMTIWLIVGAILLDHAEE